jgi:hypothetical protein
MGKFLISLCYYNQVCTRIFIEGVGVLNLRLYMFDFKNYIIDNIS